MRQYIELGRDTLDKYEYKIRADEIKELIAAGEYQQAAEIADTVDWRRVKSVMMLCTISDLYKINRRYEDAKNMLLLAYERRPGGKTICYSLCELCIKTEEFVQAVNYYKEFVQVAPKDSGRYILQYKLYEAQDVSLEERISVLEELKKRDYREKWAYELAYLYHRVGLATRCVEECDELILWFGEGKYVIKAMELKMLHQPLSAGQQEKYDHRFDPVEKTVAAEEQSDWGEASQEAAQSGWGEASQETAQSGWGEAPQETAQSGWGEAPQGAAQSGWGEAPQGAAQSGWGEAPQEAAQSGWGEAPQEAAQSGWDNSSWNAGSDLGNWPEAGSAEQAADVNQAGDAGYPGWNEQETAGNGWEVSGDTRTDWVLSGPAPMPGETAYDMPRQSEPEEMDIQVKTLDMGAYNTINLQAEIAAGLQEVLADNKAQSDEITRSIIAPLLDSDTESLDLPEIDEVDEDDLEPEKEIMEGTEVFFGETGELGNIRKEEPFDRGNPGAAETFVSEEPLQEQAADGEETVEDAASGKPVPEGMEELHADETAKIVMDQMRMENLGQKVEQVLTAQPPRELAGVLSQESDGQISLVVPENETIEKQITGQMNFDDILDEWEKLKQENKEKQQEEMRRHVLEQTGDMFTEFEKSVKDGLLEQLENESAEAGPVEEELTEEEPIDFETYGEEEAGGEEIPEEEPSEAEDVEAEAYSEEEGDGGEGIEEEAYSEAEGDGEEEAGGEEIPEEEPSEAEDVEAEAYSEEEGDGGEGIEEEAYSEAEGDGEEEAGGEEIPEEEPSGAEDVEADGHTGPDGKGEKKVSGARTLTRDEKELYAPFIQSRSGRERLVKAIDSISMAAYTGNVIITGERGMDTLSLAKNMIREIQMTDSNFSGKIAKISGQGLNTKNVAETLERLNGGALIIQKVSDLEAPAAEALQRSLQKENFGIIVFMEDTRKAVDKFLETYPKLGESFTARMDVEAMSNDSLVAFGRQYARELEYSIDDLGILALHTRIEERQTLDHVVTVMEVKEIVDDAIRHVNRKTLGHFFDILFARRYDEEDMIILTEKDFE